jgi:PAS domain S-box-containing protein
MKKRVLSRSAHLMEEAEQTLRAIQHGAVDAFVVQEADGHRVYTLEGADLPYSTLVERMQQGAAMLDAQQCLLYCNVSLAQLIGLPKEKVIGRALHEFVDPGDRQAYEALLEAAKTGFSAGEIRLRLGDGSIIAAEFSFSVLARDKSALGVLITDLTAQKLQMEFSSRLQTMQDEERRRIARELHDSAGQLLTAILINLSMVSSQASKLDEKGERALTDIHSMVQQVSSEIRTISHLLHPPLLEFAGLESTLQWYVHGFSERGNIPVDLEISEDIGRLPDDVEIAVFRIVQECLTNIHRHSGSPTAAIRLQLDGDRLQLQVEDQGSGIPQHKQRDVLERGRGGVGLTGMRERTRLLGGTLEVQSSPSGTVVTATFLVR